jgi:hypothetical protein
MPIHRGGRNYDELMERTAYHGRSPLECDDRKTPGVSQAYLERHTDKDGWWRPAATSRHTLHVSANPPAAVLVDHRLTPRRERSSITRSSAATAHTRQAEVNADGSVDSFRSKPARWLQDNWADDPRPFGFAPALYGPLKPISTRAGSSTTSN